jgi:cytochrome P450
MATAQREAVVAEPGDEMDVEHHYDHRLVAEMVDPSDVLAYGHAKCPVTHSDAHDGYWVVFGYDDVNHIARNPEVFSSNQGLGIPDHNYPVRLPPIEIDPPRHIQYRSPLLERFSPTSVGRMEHEIRAIVTELLDAFIERGEADLATELTIPLPNTVIPRLFNLPAEDGERFQDWAARSLQVSGDMTPYLEMFTYFMEVHADRVANPRGPDDFVTLLMSIELEGVPISMEEVVGMMCTFVSAGVDTTANAAAHVLDILTRQPHLRQRLLDDPAILPSAIEEMLRYITPVALEARVTTEDVVVGGVGIPKGERVTVNWLAANRDPNEFPNPSELDFDRAPNRHVAFGAGPHRCIGAHLARAELRVLLEEVLRRIPDFEVDVDRVVRYAGITRGISSLPARFTPGTKEATSA